MVWLKILKWNSIVFSASFLGKKRRHGKMSESDQFHKASDVTDAYWCYIANKITLYYSNGNATLKCISCTFFLWCLFVLNHTTSTFVTIKSVERITSLMFSWKWMKLYTILIPSNWYTVVTISNSFHNLKKHFSCVIVQRNVIRNYQKKMIQ